MYGAVYDEFFRGIRERAQLMPAVRFSPEALDATSPAAGVCFAPGAGLDGTRRPAADSGIVPPNRLPEPSPIPAIASRVPRGSRPRLSP